MRTSINQDQGHVIHDTLMQFTSLLVKTFISGWASAVLLAKKQPAFQLTGSPCPGYCTLSMPALKLVQVKTHNMFSDSVLLWSWETTSKDLALIKERQHCYKWS